MKKAYSSCSRGCSDQHQRTVIAPPGASTAASAGSNNCIRPASRVVDTWSVGVVMVVGPELPWSVRLSPLPLDGRSTAMTITATISKIAATAIAGRLCSANQARAGAGFHRPASRPILFSLSAAMALSNPATTSSMDWKRCSGALFKQLLTTSALSAVRSSLTLSRGMGGATPPGQRRSSGVSMLSNSYSIIPSE